jgi:uncharacterized protein (TIGR00255 family)
MTGYGRAALTLGGRDLVVEVNGVNRRGLELFVSGPQEWAGPLERHVTAWAREFVARGKCSVFIRLAGASATRSLAWDPAAVAASLEKLAAQAAVSGVPFAPDSALLLRLAELNPAQGDSLPSLDDDSARATLAEGVRAALRAFAAMRAEEGAFLAKDLLARLDVLEKQVAETAALSAGTAAEQRDALLARLAAAGLELDPSDERVLKEVALFADRCDVTEEITRLRSHIAQFRAAITAGASDGVGRKLDFICQEMNRELNTIGSKANRVEVTRLIIEAKNELERVREQVQNVE